MPKQAPLEQVLDGQQHSAKPQWLHFPISIVPAARQAGVERLLEMAASMLAVIRPCAQATNEKVAAAYLPDLRCSKGHFKIFQCDANVAAKVMCRLIIKHRFLMMVRRESAAWW